jgi:hypothetical protein
MRERVENRLRGTRELPVNVRRTESPKREARPSWPRGPRTRSSLAATMTAWGGDQNP